MVSVGGRNERLRKLAIAAAKRAGPVEIDHGDTSCKTVDVVEYIGKMWARKEKAAPAAKEAPPAAKAPPVAAKRKAK